MQVPWEKFISSVGWERKGRWQIQALITIFCTARWIPSILSERFMGLVQESTQRTHDHRLGSVCVQPTITGRKGGGMGSSRSSVAIWAFLI